MTRAAIRALSPARLDRALMRIARHLQHLARYNRLEVGGHDRADAYARSAAVVREGAARLREGRR